MLIVSPSEVRPAKELNAFKTYNPNASMRDTYIVASWFIPICLLVVMFMLYVSKRDQEKF